MTKAFWGVAAVTMAVVVFVTPSAGADPTTVVQPPPVPFSTLVTPPPLTVAFPLPVTTTVTAPPVTTTVTAPPTTTTTTTTSTTTTTTPPSPPQHLVTKPSGQCSRTGSCTVPTNLPVADGTCASAVTPTTFEPRPDNNTANHTVGPAGAIWGPWTNDAYWTGMAANLHKVTGNYTGLTTQIIQWAACKWGIDEDLLRAVAVSESSWHQNAAFDVANGCPHSFGLTQVRDSRSTCPTNHDGWGGMPGTSSSTALNVDFYGARLRSCYDGDLYDGSSYLYNGQTVTQIAATNGWDYVLMGCVGSWFSGDWYSSSAQSYINSVKGHLANKPWLQPGF